MKSYIGERLQQEAWRYYDKRRHLSYTINTQLRLTRSRKPLDYDAIVVI